MWYAAKVKGNGAKPITAHFYVEATDKANAESLAREISLGEFSLFGIRNVELFPVEYSLDKIREATAKAGGPNSAYYANGQKVE